MLIVADCEAHETAPLDPFDLPEWLGDGEVTWEPERGIAGDSLVRGRLSAGQGVALACDLLAVDEAYPRPVVDDDIRTAAHQAWRHGQVLVVMREGRPTLALPGRDFSADRVLEALARFARAVGAPPERYAALLRLGGGQRAQAPTGG